MTRSSTFDSGIRRTRAAALLEAAALVGMLFVLLHLPASGADDLNAAGLVIQHGDGRIVYLYVEFSEPEITGAQLLERSGVALEVAPYGGLGWAVCSIEGQGCSSSDCFCESYSQDAFFWRYHRLADAGDWIPLPVGPASRVIKDGDVDGWSWSAKDHGLPTTSFDEIARLNGVAGDTQLTATASQTTATPGQDVPTQPLAATPENHGGTSRGVVIDPITGVQPLVQENAAENQSSLNYIALATGVGVVTVVGGWVIWQRRRASQDD